VVIKSRLLLSLSKSFCNRTLQKHATRKVDSLSFGYLSASELLSSTRGFRHPSRRSRLSIHRRQAKASRTGSIALLDGLFSTMSIQIGGRESWVGGVHFDVGVAHHMPTVL